MPEEEKVSGQQQPPRTTKEARVENDAATPIFGAREEGLLDLSIELSARDITAGKEFAIFVLVKNPFSRPLWIRRVHLSLPSELHLAEGATSIKARQEVKKAEQQAQKEEAARQKKLLKSLDDLKAQMHSIEKQTEPENRTAHLYSLKSSFEELTTAVVGPKTGTTNVYLRGYSKVGAIKITSAKSDIAIYRGEKDHIPEFEQASSTEVGDIEVKDSFMEQERKSRSRDIELESSLPPGVALQPGCTAVYTVLLNARKPLFFTPSKYRLQFNVLYGFEAFSDQNDEKQNIFLKIYANTVASEVSIRPAVFSVMTGAVVGGLVGAISRIAQLSSPEKLSTYGSPELVAAMVSIVLAGLLSAIAVVFLARKSDAQSFIAVEDIWGGLLIGFFVGYSGTEFFARITSSVLGAATTTGG